MRELRDCVIRDMDWLLNTGNLETDEDLAAYPLVAESTLNYGIPHLAGSRVSDAEIREMERKLRQAIWRFEPRLLRDSVKVSLASDTSSKTYNAMTFYIDAMLWAEPVPWHLFLKTEVDLEMGTFSVSEAEEQGQT